MLPFLKWPGGKRWFIAKYRSHIPDNFNRYIEPFLGGGSIFFYLQPSEALISDINPELINVYIVMKYHHTSLSDLLKQHHANHSREYYYAIRENIPDNTIARAARFLYLNRTCFNGMYRVNQKGNFNVPIGTKLNCIYDIEQFPAYARALSSAEILVNDFSPVISVAKYGDLLFVDPPYTIAHNQNSFIKYNERLFTWEDQTRLFNNLCLARDDGAIVISTNANYHQINEMYQDNGFFTKPIQRYCSISGCANGRGQQEELLISSTPILKE
jgi:DNA adenine methylase